jgi:hypothetical protein
MRPVLLLLAVALLARAADPEPYDPKAMRVREVTLPALGLPKAAAFPLKVTGSTDLAKVSSSKATQEELKKNTNFAKEYLLIFSWAGSGGDRLSYRTEKGDKGPVVVFTLTRGRTKDLHRHQMAYAVPKAMTYRFGK